MLFFFGHCLPLYDEARLTPASTPLLSYIVTCITNTTDQSHKHHFRLILSETIVYLWAQVHWIVLFCCFVFLYNSSKFFDRNTKNDFFAWILSVFLFFLRRFNTLKYKCPNSMVVVEFRAIDTCFVWMVFSFVFPLSLFVILLGKRNIIYTQNRLLFSLFFLCRRMKMKLNEGFLLVIRYGKSIWV